MFNHNSKSTHYNDRSFIKGIISPEQKLAINYLDITSLALPNK
ncbi:hypothetical protein [Colwellia sp. E2M01]|nr:hypothetical protein [Colwellia sp. E2M01]